MTANNRQPAPIFVGHLDHAVQVIPAGPDETDYDNCALTCTRPGCLPFTVHPQPLPLAIEWARAHVTAPSRPVLNNP